MRVSLPDWLTRILLFYFPKGEIQTKSATDCIKYQRAEASIGDFSAPSKPTAPKKKAASASECNSCLPIPLANQDRRKLPKTDRYWRLPIVSTRFFSSRELRRWGCVSFARVAVRGWRHVKSWNLSLECLQLFQLFFSFVFLLKSTGAYRHFSVLAFSYWK